MKLLIATPFYEMKGYSPYIMSLVQTIIMLNKSNIVVDYWELSQDSYIDRARNTLTNKFLNSDYTHLFFIDSDHGWDGISFLNILKHADKDIVAAGYPCKNKWNFYGCVLKTQPGYETRLFDDGVSRCGPPVVTEEGLVEALFAPTGFMMIRKEVFQKLSECFPENCYTEMGKVQYNFFGRIPPLGEDSSFCQRWRDAGGKIHVQPDCTISHYGIKEYKGNYLQEMLKWPEAKKEQA